MVAVGAELLPYFLFYSGDVYLIGLEFLRCFSFTGGLQFLKPSAADCVKGFDQSSHVFPSLDQLQQQFSDKVHLLPYRCLFKDGSVKNVVPDPVSPLVVMQIHQSLIYILKQNLNLAVEIKIRQQLGYCQIFH